MDRALQEENKKWLRDNNVPDDNYWKYTPQKTDPRFDNPKVRDSYLRRRAQEIKDSRRENRPYKNPPILLDPPTDDKADVNHLQKVTENWDFDSEDDDNDDDSIMSFDSQSRQSGEESEDSFGTNES
ncbi:uncharacterized protein EV420DRAFT_1646152 [Desarmillaria tabescens]|uniref:Uncharacterized protein n=1 Tax=Armillaria tabescens TaxID=1929756 RepID=A0AA39MZ36_ARMTA|nr:uncharacterized protein EV420DRAFT_1646152 [Desarmillaria tabescens]KAK0451414.1 hypothetical protein EV420DRAFT_1646152 [Desarmillaria tabescens]